jgi:nitroimidazol reductase NimA-like FMN-containing flavoprotein (pyridoxamine 5'-phosphate oxidase superfamily)
MHDAAALDMVRTMLTQAEIGRLASVGAGGQPTIAPFWFFFDGVRIAIRMLENASIRNVRARPAVAFQVDFGHRYADLRGVVVRGTAHVYRPEEAPPETRTAAEGYDRKYAEYWLEARALGDRHRTQPRRSPVLLVITSHRAQWHTVGGSIWGHVDFPGTDGP